MASDPFIDEINARLHYLEHSRAADAQPGVTLRIALATPSSDVPALHRDLRSEHHATRAKQKQAMVRSVGNAVAQEQHQAERHQRHTTRLPAVPATLRPISTGEAAEGRHEHWREREPTW